MRGAAGKECVFFPSLDKAERYPVNGPRAGRLSFKLSSTMQSVGEVEATAEKLACEAGLDPVVSIWDIAPLQVIVEEAGGKFTDLAGQRRLDGGNALSSNGLVHDDVVAALASDTHGLVTPMV